ncbi:hypothetical protein QBC45DRAFT_325147 [Copromyces sp. CBS 386.78]|nr:hypothetical protein QBC45DRAFT_325147 [Copromyces sp. CBS 386.78]
MGLVPNICVTQWLKTAAQANDPNLQLMWDIIIHIQERIVDQATGALRPFHFFRWTNPVVQAPELASIAYDWLLRHNQSLTIRAAIEEVGHTKPGLLAQLRSPHGGLAEHELSTAQRKTKDPEKRPDQTLPQINNMWSEVESWAAAGAMRSLTNTPFVDPATIADIPQTEQAKKGYVWALMSALKRMDLKVPGDVKEANLVSFTSVKALQAVCWDFLVSTHLFPTRYTLSDPSTNCYVS